MTGVLVAPALWPRYDSPDDLASIERLALKSRPLPTSTYDALRTTATRDLDATAMLVLPDGGRWDAPVEVGYGALLRRVTSYANVLTALGADRRAAVALLSPNVLELVPALLAAEAAAIAVPVNPALNAHTITTLLRRAGVTVLVAAGPGVDPQVWQLAREVATDLGVGALLALRPSAASDDAPLQPLPGTRVAYLDDLAADQPEDQLLGPEPGPGDLAALFHTGGTMGTPKLAAHTHRMQVVDAWAIAALGSLGPGATMLAALPLFHVNALLVTVLAPVLRGTRVVWAGPLGYRDLPLMGAFWKVVERYGITAMSGVPAVYDGLTRMPVDADISSLQLPVVGAAPLPPAVRDAWLAHTGVPLCEGYGLTEATCATARSFPDHPRPDSVGQRLPYQQVASVAVDDATGQWTFLPPGRTGILVVSGPTVFPGYVVGWDSSGPLVDAGDKVRHGWLDTGDLGSVSPDGFITVTGRAKDLIIRGGHNIDPASVETVLRAHPSVVDAGVVGRPDQHSGEVPVAFVVLRDRSADAEVIRSWAADRVAEPAATPKTVTVLPALPYTAVGKPYKPALRVLATTQELAERLAELGCPPPAGSDWCAEHDGQVCVVLPAPGDDQLRVALEDLLGRYPLTWRLT